MTITKNDLDIIGGALARIANSIDRQSKLLTLLFFQDATVSLTSDIACPACAARDAAKGGEIKIEAEKTQPAVPSFDSVGLDAPGSEGVG